MRAYDSKSSMKNKNFLSLFFSGFGDRRACCTHRVSSMCNYITVDWEIVAQKLASN